jgi:hypothetical protein
MICVGDIQGKDYCKGEKFTKFVFFFKFKNIFSRAPITVFVIF